MSKQVRILVVEDEAVVAMDVRNQLESLGYEVVATSNSAAGAIESVRTTEPDLVLMDIQLSGDRDGISAAEEIRRLSGTPVVFLTAFADEASLERATEISPHGYIVKPFDERDLNTSIEIALSRSRAEHHLERRRDDLMAVLDVQRQGAMTIDGDARVTFVSRAAERMIGKTKEEVVGERWEAVLPVERAVIDQLAEMATRPSSERTKVSAELTIDDGSSAIEIELVDDPRSGERFILFLYDVSEVQMLRSLLDRGAAFERLIGSGKAMQAVFQLIRDVADVDSPVLVQGETGTGKELVARAIHRRSSRKEGPFVPVNCGGLSSELATSQLFGHRRGAFTGASSNHRGYFLEAHLGTLFLDEIGELPLAVQPALLRALDDRKIAPVGESRPREVDFRLIAASIRSLEQEIESQTFRSDLYYRLSVVRIELPPLRERPEDLPVLIREFVAQARVRTAKDIQGLSDPALSVLMQYSWPGNVRQLKNAIEFAAIRARGPEIELEDLPPEVRGDTSRAASPVDEAETIRAALAQTGGNRRKAAELLGMSRSTFYRRLARLGNQP